MMNEKLWMLSSDIMPTIFMKARTKEQALSILLKGMDVEVYRRFVEDATFRINEILTLERFLELCPDEFRIDDETGF